MANKEQILNALSKVNDPELKKPLTELDMIQGIDLLDKTVTIKVLLTVPGCPLKNKIVEDITTAILNLEGVENVKVEFDVMSPEQLEKLKQKLGQGQVSSINNFDHKNIANRIIAVASGKGGVGKSTITTNLAVALARMGHRVGLLDADVYGFSIPRMIGVSGNPEIIDENKIVPLRYGNNIQIVSIGFFINENEPVIWRGPLLHKAINEFLFDTQWENLDYLVIDLPPGTGDVTLTIAEAIPNAELLVITTPQPTATSVAGRVARLAEKTNLKVIGVIENMAYYERDGKKDYIFGKDGGKDLARELGVEFIGEIPFMVSLRESSDIGHPLASEGNKEEVTLFETIANKVKYIKH